MDIDIFMVCIKKEDAHVDIAKYVETGFRNLNYELDRPSPKRKNKKIIALMEN